MTRAQERSAELAICLRAVEEQSVRFAVAVCHKRDLPTLRRYYALMERDHGGKESAYSVAAMVKASRLLAEAEQVAELERMAGL